MVKNFVSILIILMLVVYPINMAFGMAEGPPSEEEEFKGTEVDITRHSDIVSNLVHIISRDSQDIYPKVSPDSDTIVFASKLKKEKSFNIWACTKDGRSFKMVTNDSYNNENPSFLGEADSLKVIFNSDRLGPIKLWKKDISGKGGTVQLSTGTSFDFQPDVNSEARKIVFSSSPVKPRTELVVTEYGARWKIFDAAPMMWTMDVDGRNLTQFGDGVRPTWSPRGDKMAFSRNTGENYDIFIMDQDGANLTQLTTDNADDLEPFWSPDGKSIVFTSSRTGNFDIWKIDVDGTGLTQLTIHDGYDGAPCWSSDGKHVYFHSYRSGNWDIWRMEI